MINIEKKDEFMRLIPQENNLLIDLTNPENIVSDIFLISIQPSAISYQLSAISYCF
ncbi:MAG: hypothetical protein F6K54_02615 [Okeania sp. SIO3B5]|uniref:hypothetical protein n=1 Tax=Okeania sp. SIO3B5 TaxID=2607811 RepID=UPI0014012DD7|nr:hypothetical protein [Okeania sp. SIO3B5]NEO52070.1 hypothetical protein [Okeania sp. SIO3B5]